MAHGDDLRRVRQEQPVPKAAHSLHCKHIRRKTVATRCLSQERSFTDLGYRLGWPSEFFSKSSLPVPDSPESRTVVSVARGSHTKATGIYGNPATRGYRLQ